jgi:hypothetical protein
MWAKEGTKELGMEAKKIKKKATTQHKKEMP